MHPTLLYATFACRFWFGIKTIRDRTAIVYEANCNSAARIEQPHDGSRAGRRWGAAQQDHPGRLREPDDRCQHQRGEGRGLSWTGQDIPRSHHAIRHDTGEPTDHHGWRQRLGLQRRAPDNRRLRHDTDERRGMVWRPGQLHGDAHQRPHVHHGRPREGQSPQGLAFTL